MHHAAAAHTRSAFTHSSLTAVYSNRYVKTWDEGTEILESVALYNRQWSSGLIAHPSGLATPSLSEHAADGQLQSSFQMRSRSEAAADTIRSGYGVGPGLGTVDELTVTALHGAVAAACVFGGRFD